MTHKPRSRYPYSVVRDRLRHHGASYLDFALGNHREPLPSGIAEALVRQQALATRPCGREDVEAFAAAAATMLARRYGASVDPSAILPAPGGRPALAALTATILSPGELVIVTEPSYPVFARLAAQAQGRLHVAWLDPDHGFAPHLAEDGSGGGESARLLALNYPNNPTGAVPSPAVLGELRRAVGPRTLWLNDATYGPLTFDGPPFSLLASGATVAGATPAVELHSLGKIFPLGPLSTSLLAGDAEVVDAVREYSEFAWSPMSALQLRLGCACLEDDAHVAAVREAARARLARLHEALEALGFACFPTQGGLYQLCRAPASVGGHRVGGAAEAAELLLSRHHLAAVPFEAGGHGYLRFSGLYVERDVEALERLASSGPLVG